RVRHGEEPPRRFRRTGCRAGCAVGRRSRLCWVGMREGEEAARVLGHVLEIGEAARAADDVEGGALRARRHVTPLARRALAGFRAGQAHEHGASGSVLHVADQPVSPSALAGREIVAANRLGLAAKADRQFGCVVAQHQAASRSPMRSTGQRSKSLASTAGPLASTGTNMRNFHEMISWKRPYAVRRWRMVSVKPESSMRFTPMTRTRRSWRPSERSRIVRPSISAAKASFGVTFAMPVVVAFAAQAGETLRPMMRSPASDWRR